MQTLTGPTKLSTRQDGSRPKTQFLARNKSTTAWQGCPLQLYRLCWKYQRGIYVGQYFVNRLKAGAGRRLTAEPLTKVVGPGTCGLLVLYQRHACRYDLTGGSKPTCFKQLRILNAFEITLWQTGSTSKRADVILGLLATTTAESTQAVHATWQESRKRRRRFYTFTRGSARFKNGARVGSASW